jgi:hypothetical protein
MALLFGRTKPERPPIARRMRKNPEFACRNTTLPRTTAMAATITVATSYTTSGEYVMRS